MDDNSTQPSQVVYEWFIASNRDELSARSILQHKDGHPNTVCFLSQQIAEKHLKAFLVSKGIMPEKTHALDLLIKNCGDFDKTFLELADDASILSAVYVESRYPGDIPEYEWQEAKNFFERALRIKEFVLGKIAS